MMHKIHNSKVLFCKVTQYKNNMSDCTTHQNSDLHGYSLVDHVSSEISSEIVRLRLDNVLAYAHRIWEFCTAIVSMALSNIITLIRIKKDKEILTSSIKQFYHIKKVIKM